MMARQVCAEVFDPIALVGDKLRLIGEGYEGKYYEVQHVEPILPWIVDFVDSAYYGAVIPANGSTGYDTSFYEMDTELDMPDTMLAQIRIACVDDILLAIGHDAQRLILHDTKQHDTYLSKHRPRHSAFERTVAINTESSLWTVSNNAEAGVRVAKLVKLTVQSEAAAAGIIRIGDGTGAGTDANAANADMSFAIGANESLHIGEDELPEIEFHTGVTWQTSVQPVRITVTVEEDNLNLFEKNQESEIFVWEDNVPYFRCINPIETTTLASARIQMRGYKYLLKEISKPVKWSDVPIAAMPRV